MIWIEKLVISINVKLKIQLMTVLNSLECIKHFQTLLSVIIWNSALDIIFGEKMN